MPAQSYNIAYTSNSNVIPLPHANFISEGNTSKYSSMAIGGRRDRKRKSTRKSLRGVRKGKKNRRTQRR